MGTIINSAEKWLFSNFFLIATLTLLSLCLSGCEKLKGPIKIGLATTLTGPSSTSGIHSRNAVMLAVEQLNQSGGIHGRQVELIVKDDKGRGDEAVRVDRELVKEGVVAVVGHYLSTLSIQAVPVLNESQLLMISSGTTTPELSGLDDSLIRLMVPDERRTKLWARMVYERLNVKKMAVLFDTSNPNYAIPFSNYFQQHFTHEGGQISAAIPFNSLEPYSATEIARKVIDSGAEGVLLITNAINGALLCQHLRRIDPEIKLTASPWTLPEVDFIKDGGRAVEGATCLVELDPQSSNGKFKKFREQYQKRYDQQLSLNGYIAYEAVQILFKALTKTEDPRELKGVILKQGVFEGLIDTISLDSFGDPTRPLYILEIQNAQIRTIGKME